MSSQASFTSAPPDAPDIEEQRSYMAPFAEHSLIVLAIKDI